MIDNWKISETVYTWVVGNDTGITIKDGCQWVVQNIPPTFSKRCDTLKGCTEFLNNHYDLPDKQKQYE